MEINLKNNIYKGVGIPLALVVFMSLMIMPVPPILLDMFFTFSISVSLLVLLVCIYCMRPLDFGIFPTIVLLATLLRLALNVASTRVVLLNGHTGNNAAGKVIEAFGEVVIGGDYAVGIIVFSILIIINFVVVTKGAGRISEVSARFTLDALPGKQMSVDADLNSGLISQEVARERRKDLTAEAEFYGSMDGASKFVRGDAIAGILILLINLIGGIAIGMYKHGLEFNSALEIYAILTIGDGLVAQIPALILSVAAAIMVTRVSESENLGQQVLSQIFDNPKPLIVVGIVIFSLGLIPGMPHFMFMVLGSAIIYVGYKMHKKNNIRSKKADSISEIEQKTEEKTNEDISWDNVGSVDPISLDVGYRLIPLVDNKKDGKLMSRIKGVRKKISNELGFLIPTVHIKDDLDLAPNAYRISIFGIVVAESTVYLDKELAISSGDVLTGIQGIKIKEPAFGLDAYWIDSPEKQNAQNLGYTLVDCSTVIATHLSKLIKDNGYKLLGHDEVQKLLDIVAETSPLLVEELVPKCLSLGAVVNILRNLMKENAPIKDLKSIFNTLSENAGKTKDIALLTEAVRTTLGPFIIQEINGVNDEIPVITFATELEQLLHNSVNTETDSDNMMIEPGLAKKIEEEVYKCHQANELNGIPTILVVASKIRYFMSRFVRNFMPKASVLSYSEIPDDKHIKIVGSIGTSGS